MTKKKGFLSLTLLWLVACLSVTACTPTPEVIRETVEVTIEVTRVVEKMVTATPLPHTPTPTDRPGPSPTPAKAPIPTHTPIRPTATPVPTPTPRSLTDEIASYEIRLNIITIRGLEAMGESFAVTDLVTEANNDFDIFCEPDVLKETIRIQNTMADLTSELRLMIPRSDFPSDLRDSHGLLLNICETWTSGLAGLIRFCETHDLNYVVEAMTAFITVDSLLDQW